MGAEEAEVAAEDLRRQLAETRAVGKVEMKAKEEDLEDAMHRITKLEKDLKLAQAGAEQQLAEAREQLLKEASERESLGAAGEQEATKLRYCLRLGRQANRILLSASTAVNWPVTHPYLHSL